MATMTMPRRCLPCWAHPIPKAIFIHPAALEEKFTSNWRSPPGVPSEFRPNRARRWKPCGLESTGPGARRKSFQARGDRRDPTGEPGRNHEQSFYLDPYGRVIDPWTTISLCSLKRVEVLVVVAGCAHAGAVNTLDHVCRLTGRLRLLALIGGLHLGRASRKRLE